MTLESLMILLIALSPIFFKFYDFLPDDPEAKVEVLGITIDNNGFHSVSVYFWFLMSKVIPLYLMIFWFFTSKNWWYHIILIPIGMYSFQLFEVIFDSDDNIDTESIWWLLPVCMVVIPFVYFIRIKLYDKHVNGIDFEAMEAELKALKKKEGYIETIEDPEKAFKAAEKSAEVQEEMPLSFSDKIDKKLSTHNLENLLKQFQRNLKSWTHLKF